MMHSLDEFSKDELQFDVAVCNCGWTGPPCPDKITAANFWGQHLLAAHASHLAKQEAPGD